MVSDTRLSPKQLDRNRKKWKFRWLVLTIVATLTLLSNLPILFSQLSNAPIKDGIYIAQSTGMHKMTAQEYIRIGSLWDVPPDDVPPALPTPPLTKQQIESNQKIADHLQFRVKSGYEGKQDALHLGGFTSIDIEGISPAVWKDMIEFLGVKSILDIGCGKAVSTSWFYLQGVDAYCVEGSHDAIGQNLLPPLVAQRFPNQQERNKEIHRILYEHDFSRGPWWLDHTVDAVWCVEFTEHVGRPFLWNYLVAMKKAAVIFVTHSTWGGWHHVEVHDDDYWIGKFEAMGFHYSQVLTNRYRKIAKDEMGKSYLIDPSEPYSAKHLIRNLLVLINPAVAARRSHHHLFAEGGCFDDYDKPTFHCGDKLQDERTPIPPEWKPIPFLEEKEKEWANLVRSFVGKNSSNEQL